MIEAGRAAPDGAAANQRRERRLELLEAILLALAGILTAWAAFEATKWSGVQADEYSRAAAARTESVRASTRAGQLASVDVNTFTSWIAAISAEERAGIDSGLGADGQYAPQPGTESGFFYERFRPEFRIAMEEWFDSRPFSDPAGAPTPFAVEGYQLAQDQMAVEFEQEADSHARAAREANQRGDNYVLMTIVFAFVLVMVGIGSKMDTVRARILLIGLAASALAVASIIIVTFPVEI